MPLKNKEIHWDQCGSLKLNLRNIYTRTCFQVLLTSGGASQMFQPVPLWGFLSAIATVSSFWTMGTKLSGSILCICLDLSKAQSSCTLELLLWSFKEQSNISFSLNYSHVPTTINFQSKGTIQIQTQGFSFGVHHVLFQICLHKIL